MNFGRKNPARYAGKCLIWRAFLLDTRSVTFSRKITAQTSLQAAAMQI
tara:strand:+ start:562 stop:705 length:144 start_codon:yes stop_codon:yes gene_type:complete